jgi:ribosomal protein S17E
MGKAMSNAIKAKAKIIVTEFKDKLSIDFKKNKDFLKSLNLPLSKLTINLMAGYITRFFKKEKKDAEELANLGNRGARDASKTPMKEVRDTKIHG